MLGRWLTPVPIASLHTHEDRNQKHLAWNGGALHSPLYCGGFFGDSRSRMATSVNMKKQIGFIIAMAEKYGHLRFGSRKETALGPAPSPSRNDHTDPASNNIFSLNCNHSYPPQFPSRTLAGAPRGDWVNSAKRYVPSLFTHLCGLGYGFGLSIVMSESR